MEIDRRRLILITSLVLLFSDMVVYLILTAISGWHWPLLLPMLVVSAISVLFVSLLLVTIPHLIEPKLRFPLNLTLPTLSVAFLVTMSILVLSQSPSIMSPLPIQIIAGLWRRPLIFLMSWALKVCGLSMVMLVGRSQTNRGPHSE